ncbi:MAG: 50S ribosomal protein L13 [Nanoarchaeota archaeon]
MADEIKATPMIVIDAADSIVGRFCTHAAIHALKGSNVSIINCEKALMTGSRAWIFAKYGHARSDRGQIRHGPYIHRGSDKFVRRIVRGMLPWSKERGQTAFRRVMCYIGVPPQFKDVKAEQVKGAHLSKLNTLKYIKIGDLCKHLGAKQ